MLTPRYQYGDDLYKAILGQKNALHFATKYLLANYLLVGAYIFLDIVYSLSSLKALPLTVTEPSLICFA